MKNKPASYMKHAVWLTLRRTNEPVCPFGSLFSMPCQAALLGAAAEGQTRTRFPSLPVAFSLREDAHVERPTTSMMNQRVGRVSGDSDCRGPINPPLRLSQRAQVPPIQITVFGYTSGELRPHLAGGISQSYQTALWLMRGFLWVFLSAFIAAATEKEADLIVFTVQP